MDLSEALFTSLLALKTADTGAGGLNNTSATAYVAQFVQEDDASLSPERAGFPPMIVVDILENDDQPWLAASAYSLVGVTVRMTVYTWRDPGRSKQNAINKRMLTVFDGITPATQTGWNFGPLMRAGGQQVGTDRTRLVYVHEFVVRAAST